MLHAASGGWNGILKTKQLHYACTFQRGHTGQAEGTFIQIYFESKLSNSQNHSSILSNFQYWGTLLAVSVWVI
jgi:hypothetical protein